MKTTSLKTIAAAASLGIFIPAIALAQTPQNPAIPHQFFGAVHYASGTTPNGLLVEAKIKGVVVGSSVTAGENYGYSPNLLFVTDSQSTHAGNTIEFSVAGTKANETAIFTNGRSTQLNLTLPGSSAPAPTAPPIPTPTPPPIPASTPAPTNNNGGGGIFTPSASSPALSVAAQRVDANKDAKIDILDFNTLMVNWGRTGGGATDFNGDGKIDVFDFNLLMINWTL